jgi:hypothetical protein
MNFPSATLASTSTILTESPLREIEQAVVSAMYTARAHQHNLTQQDLISEIQQTRPLSVVMAEKVQETRDWASSRTVPCD